MDDRSNGANSSSGARQWPFLRLFTAEFLNEIFDLTDRQRGLLITTMALLHQYGEPMPIDDRQLARRCKSTSRSFGEDLQAVLETGLLERNENGLLWSSLVAEELLRCAQKSHKASVSAAQGHRKRKQNQRASSENAMHKEGDREGDRDSGDLSDHQKSNRSSDSNERKKAARGSAASHQPGDEIDLPQGKGWVEKIISLNPPIVAAIFRDDDGYSSGYRVQLLNSGKLRVSEMDLEEIDALPDMPEDDTHDAA